MRRMSASLAAMALNTLAAMPGRSPCSVRLEVSGHGCSESVLPRYNLISGRGWDGTYGIYAPCNYLKNGWGKRYAKPGSNGYRNVSTNRPIRYMGIG